MSNHGEYRNNRKENEVRINGNRNSGRSRRRRSRDRKRDLSRSRDGSFHIELDMDEFRQLTAEQKKSILKAVISQMDDKDSRKKESEGQHHNPEGSQGKKKSGLSKLRKNVNLIAAAFAGFILGLLTLVVVSASVGY